MARRDEVFRITDASQSVAQERQARTRRYLISMTIRTVCFITAILVSGWLTWVLFAAAIILPYIAVVVANSVVRPSTPIGMPPVILKDTTELPVGHPDRTV
jgi:fatty acid desaturase